MTDADKIIEHALELIPALETHLLRSQDALQTYKIQVMRPVRKQGETSRFPVVYATDANLTFDMLKGISHIIQSAEGAVPRFILVGIGYPGENPRAGAYLRGRDFIFPGYPELSREPPAAEGVLLAEPGSKHSHGAEQFQQFIERELIPFIDEKYESIPGERIYFGHSAGGGFGLHTLFTKSTLFRSYIISSPGLVYHGKSSAGVHYDNYDFLLRDARRFISAHPALNGVNLYLSVGAEEEFEPAFAQWQLTSAVYRLAALMRAAAMPGLRLTCDVFPRERHMTVWPVAFTHGVRAVLSDGGTIGVAGTAMEKASA